MSQISDLHFKQYILEEIFTPFKLYTITFSNISILKKTKTGELQFHHKMVHKISQEKENEKETDCPTLYLHALPTARMHPCQQSSLLFFSHGWTDSDQPSIKIRERRLGGESCCFHASFEAVPETGAFHLPTPLPSSNQSPHQMAAPIRYLKAQGYSLPVGSPKTWNITAHISITVYIYNWM